MWIHQHIDIVAAKIAPMMGKSIRHILAMPADGEVPVRAVGYADITFGFDVELMPGGRVDEPPGAEATATTLGQCFRYWSSGF